MAVTHRHPPAAPALLDLKSAVLTLTSLCVRSADLSDLRRELDLQTADAPGLFDHDPLLLDLGPLDADDAARLDLAELVEMLRRHRLLPIACRGGGAELQARARELGLAEAPAESGMPRAAAVVEAVPEEPPEEPPEQRSAALDAGPATAPATTLVIDRPLRSGQRVYARGGDLVVLAVVSHGAEVIADGSIHVYAPLRGRAIAGARGDAGARIFSTCLEPQLVSIAGTWRTFETPLGADLQGRPAQVRLDGERLIVEPLKQR
ncbi:septum site-determining protein MinC [Leptothrix discophora]|uniref:Probable septum site-determining protein MinC n=1 Tax=Leptothrix discophora TaxID=89 RepID=A0ABT9G7L1_LEPDI|nr:septum site-determining protein MinC [Leptothrix discophora]MDP4302467.1 septum site-determining protein MinC [Leptothrix discophora]